MNNITILSKNYRQIEKAIKYIDKNFRNQPSINEISEYIGVSKFHFIRIFKNYVGVTPKQFLHSINLNYAKKYLKNSKSILDSSLEIGLSSTSRLHELFVTLEGVTPKEWKEKGKNVLINYGYGQTPFGEALIGITEKGICFLEFIDENKNDIFNRFIKLWENANLQFNEVIANEYLKNIFSENKRYPLLVKGTNLQINVWKALLNLEKGKITTYQNIANYIEKPKAVRAVGNAIGKNHIAYIIPCHRVISKSGAINGYKWGINRKKVLLTYELLGKSYE